MYPRRKPRQSYVRCEGKVDALEGNLQAGLDAQAERDKVQKLEAQKYKEYNQKLQVGTAKSL